MSLKEILNRIKKLEEQTTEEDKVVLICMENGREYRKCVPIHEAAMMALRQNTAYLFGVGEKEQDRIIGVESGDDDGFIMALLNGIEDVNPDEVRAMIEV